MPRPGEGKESVDSTKAADAAGSQSCHDDAATVTDIGPLTASAVSTSGKGAPLCAASDVAAVSLTGAVSVSLNPQSADRPMEGSATAVNSMTTLSLYYEQYYILQYQCLHRIQ